MTTPERRKAVISRLRETLDALSRELDESPTDPTPPASACVLAIDALDGIRMLTEDLVSARADETARSVGVSAATASTATARMLLELGIVKAEKGAAPPKRRWENLKVVPFYHYPPLSVIDCEMVTRDVTHLLFAELDRIPIQFPATARLSVGLCEIEINKPTRADGLRREWTSTGRFENLDDLRALVNEWRRLHEAIELLRSQETGSAAAIRLEVVGAEPLKGEAG